MWTCVKWEWAKEMRLARFWGSLASLAGLGFLFAYGYVRMRGQPALQAVIGGGSRDGFFVVVLAIAVASTVLLPFFVALVSADAISGERQMSTWPTLLTQGLSPWRLYLAKWIVGVSYALLAATALVGASAAGGIVVFGWHSAVLPSGVRASAPHLAMLAVVMTGYCALGQAVVASWAVAVSAFCRHTLSSVMIVVGAVLFMVMVGDLPFAAGLQGVLFTNYFSRALDALSFPLNWAAMGQGLVVYALYGLASWGLVFWLEPFRQ